jgi:hypothetical protein
MVVKTNKFYQLESSTKKNYQKGGAASKEDLLKGLNQYLSTEQTPGALKDYIYITDTGKRIRLYNECLRKIRNSFNAKYYGNLFGRDYLADFNSDDRHVIHYDINTGDIYYIFVNGNDTRKFFQDSRELAINFYTLISLLIIEKTVSEFYVKKEEQVNIKGKTVNYKRLIPYNLANFPIDIFKQMGFEDFTKYFTPEFTDKFDLNGIKKDFLNKRDKHKTLSDLEYELYYFKKHKTTRQQFKDYKIKDKLLWKLCIDKIFKKFSEYNIVPNKDPSDDTILRFYFNTNLITYKATNPKSTIALIIYLINCSINNNCDNKELLQTFISNSYYGFRVGLSDSNRAFFTAVENKTNAIRRTKKTLTAAKNGSAAAENTAANTYNFNEAAAEANLAAFEAEMAAEQGNATANSSNSELNEVRRFEAEMATETGKTKKKLSPTRKAPSPPRKTKRGVLHLKKMTKEGQNKLISSQMKRISGRKKNNESNA